MKKQLFFGLVAALGLSACSSDDNLPGGEVTPDAGTHFLSVNIVPTANNAGGRAAGDKVTGDPNNGATYEEGYASENKVEKVRFYFFNSDGTAATVKANETNYFDWKAEDAGTNNMPNVEKQLNAVVVISTKDGDKLPTKMVAVLNFDKEGLGNESLSLTALRNRTKDYVATATGENGAFVMTNSVYSYGNTTEMAATDVPASAYQTTQDLALNNPVHIFVERNVAKVRVKFADGLNTDKGIVLTDGNGNAIKVNGKEVYFKPTAWDLTAQTNEGYLSKHIDATWSNDLFGTEPWNWSAYSRSYWAINPTSATQSWPSYTSLMDGGKQFDGTIANSLYTNENAPAIENWIGIQDVAQGGGIEKFTKVIIGGKVVDSEGNAVEICKYAGVTLVGEDALKTALLDQLKNNGMIYTKVGENSSRSLTAADVKFKTAKQAGQEADGESNPGHYYVYLQLTDDAKALSWYTDIECTKTVDSEVNTYLVKQVGTSQIYKGGLSYYYFPLRHLGADDKTGYYGVVRNHIYECNVNTITGLGTPVYDPDENIWPEKPVDEDTYIAAKVNILSWRVVPNNVDLKW